jgi:antitoxin HicB
MNPGPKRLPARFYRSDRGREPVREWLQGLEREDRKVIGEDLKDVEFSWPIGMPLVRSLGNELWEARTSLPRGRIARIIFCVERGDADMKKKNIGSSVDSRLREEGIYEEVTASAIKRVLARQVAAAMKEKHFSKAEMARRMHTSRAALDRLLDPDYEAVTLSTLRKAATAVGRDLRLELV